MKGLDLISSSLRLIGVLASGEVPSADEANDALTILNQMIDSWSAEKLMIFTDQVVTLTPGTLKQAYTLGVGGDFNQARPPKIDRMSVIILNSPNLELPIEMLSDEQWQAIPVKNVSSAVPTQVWDDGGFPLRTLSFWPIPSVSVNFVLYAWTALSQFADLSTTDYTFPPGYLKALRYNLALDLAPEFGRPVPPEVAAQAVISKAIIKTMNVQESILQIDPALGGRGGFYNWRTDQ